MRLPGDDPGELRRASSLTWNVLVIRSLAVDLRPFLPWVDDQLKVSRVMTVVIRSINDPQPRRKRKPRKSTIFPVGM
jgi:hypothetical protein